MSIPGVHSKPELSLRAVGREEAAAAAEEAVRLCKEVQMPALVSHIEEAFAAVPAGTVDAVLPVRPDGLSNRELEVLRLIASGRSNQAIADELFISRYTAIRHVANILSKIGAANRSEAAAYAVRNGLTGERAK